MDKKRTVFLTGATGLIGSYLLKLLLDAGCKVYVLARGKDEKCAKTRVVDVLKFWNGGKIRKALKNLIVLEGDIKKEDLGLDKETGDLLRVKVEEIFHCAAVTEFSMLLPEIRKVNVKGTKNILKLALEWDKNGRCKKVNYLSTAYVCGEYKGVFKEDDLDVGQGFKTTYEQSKFEAEQIVEKYRKKGLWVDIFRPAIVLGEYNTGKINAFKNIYQLLHLWNLELFDTFPSKKDFYLCLVPVDEVCKAILAIDGYSQERNKNYFTFASENNLISLEDTLKISKGLIGFKKPKLISLGGFNRKLTPVQKIILQNNFLMYNFAVRFNTAYTQKILKKCNFAFCKINQGFFTKQILYAIKSGFLKKRSAALKS